MKQKYGRIISVVFATGFLILAWGIAYKRTVAVLRRDDRRAWEHYYRAVDLKNQGQIDEVEEELRAAIDTSVHDFPEFYHALGYHYAATLRCDRAIDMYEKALESRPEFGRDILKGLAWCQAAIGRNQDALRTLERLKREWPDWFTHIEEEFKRSLQAQMDGARAVSNRATVKIFFDAGRELSGSIPEMRGNWNESGEQSDSFGYAPSKMSRLTSTTFVGNLSLNPVADFPYHLFVALPDGKVVGQTRFVLGDQANLQLSVPSRPDRPFYGLKLRSREERRIKKSDGVRKVFIFWPDCGSWHYLRPLMIRGLAPNAQALMREGSYGEMISEPPLTAIAIQRLTSLEAPLSFWTTFVLQLKGLAFLDEMIPLPKQSGKSLAQAVGDLGIRMVDFTFNEPYVQSAGKVKEGQLDWEHENRSETFDPQHIQEHADSEFNRVLDAGKIQSFVEKRNVYGRWLLASQFEDTRKKVDLALAEFTKNSKQVVMLRIPALDLLSHYFADNTPAETERRELLESFYVYLDDLLGQVRGHLDEDDALFMISDHGILDTYRHHPVSLFLAEGPGIPKHAVVKPFLIQKFSSLLLNYLEKGVLEEPQNGTKGN